MGIVPMKKFGYIHSGREIQESVTREEMSQTMVFRKDCAECGHNFSARTGKKSSVPNALPK